GAAQAARAEARKFRRVGFMGEVYPNELLNFVQKEMLMSEMRQHTVQCLSPGGLHRMAYVEWGDPHNPRVLVCVHGLTRNARDFDVLAQALSGHYRVVCPDVVGRGRSNWLRLKDHYQVQQYV